MPKIKIPKEIVYILGFSLVLILLRFYFFHNRSLNWMVWNIFLGFIPFFISSVFLYLHQKNRLINIIFILGGIVWLLFLPNAPYLVTDIIHVRNNGFVPPVYDAILLFSSGILGMLFFSYSVFDMEQILKNKIKEKYIRMIIFAVFFLTAFGVYLGRFLRFNSWDVLTNHISFASDVWSMFSRYSSYLEFIFYIVLFFSFLSVFYYSWKSYKK